MKTIRNIPMVASSAYSKRSMDQNFLETETKNPKQMLSDAFATIQASNQIDIYQQMVTLLESNTAKYLLDAAASLAAKEKLTQDEALKRIIKFVNELNGLWNQALCTEGLKRLQSMN